MFPLMGDAYARVVEFARKEARQAADDGCQIVFDLETCGGLWGPMGETSFKCQESCRSLALSAGSWRATIRGLLRTDIYGFDIEKLNDEGETYLYHQPGLCDLISDIRDALHRSNSLCGQQPTGGLPSKSDSDTKFISQMMDTFQHSFNQLALT